MKTKAFILAICIMLTMFAACSRKGDTLYNYDFSKYLKINKYLGLEADFEDPSVITEEEIDKEIMLIRVYYSDFKKIDGRSAEIYDKVNIDYTGKINGREFDGGSGEGYDLILGSGTYIDGFEEGLLGHKAGDVVTLELTFPETYQKEELAGKNAVFTVTINSVEKPDIPELNVEFLNKISDDIGRFDNIESFRERVKSDLIKQKEDEKLSAVWNSLLKEVTIYKLPDKEKLEYKKYYIDYYTGIAKKNYGLELEDYVKRINKSTMDSFYAEANNYAENRVTTELIYAALTSEMKLTLSQEEYEAGVKKYIESDSSLFPDEAAVIKYYENKNILKQYLTWEKAVEIVVDSAVQKKSD